MKRREEPSHNVSSLSIVAVLSKSRNEWDWQDIRVQDWEPLISGCGVNEFIRHLNDMDVLITQRLRGRKWEKVVCNVIHRLTGPFKILVRGRVGEKDRAYIKTTHIYSFLIFVAIPKLYWFVSITHSDPVAGHCLFVVANNSTNPNIHMQLSVKIQLKNRPRN